MRTPFRKRRGVGVEAGYQQRIAAEVSGPRHSVQVVKDVNKAFAEAVDSVPVGGLLGAATMSLTVAWGSIKAPSFVVKAGDTPNLYAGNVSGASKEARRVKSGTRTGSQAPMVTRRF